jgi:hypothetical protein
MVVCAICERCNEYESAEAENILTKNETVDADEMTEQG